MWQIVQNYYDEARGSTFIQLQQKDDDYNVLTSRLSGNRTDTPLDDLIKEALDWWHKTHFTDKAVPEAIHKVDEMETLVETVKNAVEKTEVNIEKVDGTLTVIRQTLAESAIEQFNTVEKLYQLAEYLNFTFEGDDDNVESD